MKNMLVVGVLVLAPSLAGAAEPDAPVQIFVQADRQCSVTVQPGRIELKELFPGARAVYKDSRRNGQAIHSCEVTIPKAQLLERFSSCALASVSAETCWTSFQFAGGRSVEFSVASRPGEVGACGYVCTPRAAAALLPVKER